MADISKIKLANGATVTIKDDQGRINVNTLVGSHGITALGNAAWQDVAASISGDGLVSAAIAKAYTDQQVATIHNFDVVVPGAVAAEIPEGAIYKDGETTVTGTLKAADSTMYKLYLVKNSDAGAGAHIEYITVRSGAEGSYTYAWEAIGSTKIDLSNYVQKTTEIAGVAINGGIAKADLQTALGLGDLAYKDSANGSYTPEGTISEVDATPAGSVTLNDLKQTSTVATISTKADYTPAGSLLVDAAAQAAGNKVLKGGSISVAVKDASTASEASLTRANYTPAGSVSITASETGTFQVAGTNEASTVTVNTSNASFVQSLKAGDVAAATFTEGAFTAASYDAGFLSAGAQASFTQGTKASLTAQSTSKFAAKMPKAVVGTGSDAETLMFDYVDSSDTTLGSNFSDAVTDRGTWTEAGDDSFTPNTLQTLDATKFHGGEKAADTFAAQKLPVVNGTATALTEVISATAAAQTFTGSKYAPAFSGTEETDLKVTKAEYVKQVIDNDKTSFTGTEAALTFSGTTSSQLIPTEVKYDKATANGATFAGTTNKVTPTFTGTAATIEVE